jgi:transcriptional regulator with XRE-family HTH domain
MNMLEIAMKRTGLNQNKLALKMGYNRSYIHRVLNGEEPTEQFLNKLYDFIKFKSG